MKLLAPFTAGRDTRLSAHGLTRQLLAGVLLEQTLQRHFKPTGYQLVRVQRDVIKGLLQTQSKRGHLCFGRR